MRGLRLVAWFRVPALHVSDDVLGRTFALPAGDFAVRVRIPAGPEDGPAGEVLAWAAEGIGDVTVVGVPALRVEVETEVADDEDLGRQALVFAHAARPEARRAACRVLDHARLKGQHWLGLAGEAPGEPVAIWVETTDGERLPVRIQPHVPDLQATAGSLLVTAADLPPGPADDETTAFRRLLHDALYLTWYGTGSDLRHAVVLAATAAEIAVRRALVARARPEHARLVEELPRTYTPPANLYHKLAELILGTSLRDHDPALFQHVERLFADRDRLAHHSNAIPDDDRCRADVTAARRAVAWILHLPG